MILPLLCSSYNLLWGPEILGSRLHISVVHIALISIVNNFMILNFYCLLFVYTDSGAKVLDKDVAHEVEDESSTPKQSKLRRVNVNLLADEDKKYSGKRITRKSLEGSDATIGTFPGGKLKYFIIINHIHPGVGPLFPVRANPLVTTHQPHI